MYPYQLSKALADQRVHDMVAAAAHQDRDLRQPSKRLKGLSTQLARTTALFNSRSAARSHATRTSVSGAGPMGCSA